MCPHDIFVNTKMDLGPCKKVHSESLKTDFNNHPRCKDMFDHLLEREFSRHISEIDRVIKRGRQRVEDENKIEALYDPEKNVEVVNINKQISRAISDAEQESEKDNIDRAQDLVLIHLEELLGQKKRIISRLADDKKVQLLKAGANNQKKLRVCDICGCFLSIFDSDKRLSDHFLGKQHIGSSYMRDMIETIKKRRDERRSKPYSSSGGSNNNNNNRDSRDRRDRDRDRGRDRSRSRDRDRDRDNNNYRDRDRNRDQRNSRRRDNSRDRRRDDSRDHRRR